VAAFLPVVAEILDDDGAVRVGAIGTLMDVAGAGVAMSEIRPDRSATVELAYQSVAPARKGPLIAMAEPLRIGSKQIAVSLDVRDGCGSERFADAKPVGVGTLSFMRLPQRSDHLRLPDVQPGHERREMALPGSGLGRPLLERTGLRLVDAARGVLEIERNSWVCNSFGTINGGVVATLIEYAGEQAARGATGTPLCVADLSVLYLGQMGEGTARTSTRVIRTAVDHAVCRVELRDTSAGQRLLAVGNVTTLRWPAT
jgi:acyl-coenzyme A thioesterase PaaI-like protein